MGFSFDDEPTVDSQPELAVATCGSHNFGGRSSFNLRMRKARSTDPAGVD